MTNYEHYKSEIEKLSRMGRKVAIKKGTNEITHCSGLECNNCLFSNFSSVDCSCNQRAMAWADAEYIEPEERVDWSKVPVDTPVLVKVTCDGDWYKRYFAKYQNGCVYTFNNGATSWSCNGNIDSWNFAKLAEVEL